MHKCTKMIGNHGKITICCATIIEQHIDANHVKYLYALLVLYQRKWCYRALTVVFQFGVWRGTLGWTKTSQRPKKCDLVIEEEKKQKHTLNKWKMWLYPWKSKNLGLKSRLQKRWLVKYHSRKSNGTTTPRKIRSKLQNAPVGSASIGTSISALTHFTA